MDAAEVAMDYRPVAWPEWARLRDEGLALLSSATTDAEREAALRVLLRGWYDRSLSASINRGDWKRHPSPEQYPALLENVGLNADEMRVLRQMYPRGTGRPISGSSYWEPVRRPRRR
jgi:hypothetical protein